MGIISLKNKLNEINMQKHIKNLLILFFAIQPLLEMILNLYSDEYFSIGGISIATLVRYGLIAVIVLSTVLITIKRKITKIFICYLVVVAVYIILQWYNLRGFNFTVMDVNLEKNLVQTTLYVAKYAMPICLLYEVYALKLNLNDFKKIIISVSLFVTLSMILSNLFGVDSISYSFDSTVKPKGSIISWFISECGQDWKLFTSRGLFASGNQLSSLLSLLLPSVFWISLYSNKIWYYVITLFQLVAMLMLGTRVAVYGSILLCVGVVIIWCLDMLFSKKMLDKVNFLYLISMVCLFAIIFAHSPFFYRIESGQASIVEEENYPNVLVPDNAQNNEGDNAQNNEGDNAQNNEDDSMSNIMFEEENAEIFAQKNWIPIDIISENYKFEEHKDFWKYVVNDVEFTKRDNAREIKVLILKDIFLKKGSKLDKIVGIGEVPIYPERDFLSQKYYIGILGILLFIVPYFIIIVRYGIDCIIRLFKKKFYALQYVLLMSVIFIFGVAYLAGHTLETLLVNTYIGLICGMMLVLLNDSHKIQKEEKYYG